IGNSFTPTSYFQAIVKTGSAIYAGSFGGGVYMTTNEGANWTALNGGLSNLNVWDLDYDATYLYAATADGGIFRIPLSGSTWTAINNGLPTGYDIRALNVSGNKIFAGFSGLYYSTDNGNTWTSTANDSLAGKKVRCIYTYDNANKILVGTYNNGIYVSVNGGANFYSANTGLQTLSDVYTISILNGTTVFVGVYGLGIWKRPLSEIVSGIKNLSSEIPSAYKLGQNYPNPFNPVTNIRFELPSASNVLLKVFNSAGMEVSTIANGHYGAGVYEASFDASNLSSGVYFYRLITDRYSDTKKMMVVK
ncbi:MAG: T9SS type A sorting domain-containing protein, partial [Bacteroidetes bacterium]|nr:T9SS type A sorting domain-containing protein [Bacteroidota bacterium]